MIIYQLGAIWGEVRIIFSENLVVSPISKSSAFNVVLGGYSITVKKGKDTQNGHISILSGPITLILGPFDADLVRINENHTEKLRVVPLREIQWFQSQKGVYRSPCSENLSVVIYSG